MKTVKLTSVLALTAVAVLTFSSCQKNDINPSTNPADISSAKNNIAPKQHDVLAPTYDEGFRSITNLTSGVVADIGYVKESGGPYTNLGSTYRHFDLGGDAISATTAKCYGAAAPNRGGFNLNAKEAVVYNGSDGYARLSIANGLGTSDAAATNHTSTGGSGVPIMIGGNVTTLKFEEIEINPADGMIYGIVRNGNAIQLYKIADDGTATAQTYTANGTTTIFYNPTGNGYKSGSIAFVETYNGSGVYELAFASESTVYSTIGIVVWRYTVNPTANSYTIQSANNRTYAPAYLYGAQTGNINIASNKGVVYFARNNGAMYTLNNTNNSTTQFAISPSNVANANDFGYYKAF